MGQSQPKPKPETFIQFLTKQIRRDIESERTEELVKTVKLVTDQIPGTIEKKAAAIISSYVILAYSEYLLQEQ